MKRRLSLVAFCLVFFSLKNTAQTSQNLYISQSSDQTRLINTPDEESHPMVSPDGQHLYFVRNNHASNIGDSDKSDVWISDLQADGSWGNPINLSFPINDDGENIIVGINLDASRLYIRNEKKIFFTQKNGRVWGTLQKFQLPIEEKDVNHFFVSIDEKKVFFTSKNNTNQEDIFLCMKNESGEWSKPFALPKNINSDFDEKNMFLAANNHTIYVCSNRPNGLGGFDWYTSENLDDTWQNWSPLTNLGEPLNTKTDDIYISLSFDEKKFFTSQNANSDLRFFSKTNEKKAERLVLIKGKVDFLNGEKIEPPTINFLYFDKKNKNDKVVANSEGEFQTLLSDDDGVAFFGQNKKYYSTLDYTNFGQKSLKILDNDDFKGKTSTKDSLNKYHVDQLLIRVKGLNNEITALEDKGFVPQSTFKNKEKIGYSTDEGVEKIRQTYEENEKNTFQNDVLTLDLPKNVEEEIFASNNNQSERSAIRLLFEQYKNRKIEAKKTVVIPTNPSVNKEDDRAAIDDMVAIEGITKERQYDNFEELSTKVKADIVADISNNIKIELYDDIISDWNNWSLLGFSKEEELKIDKNLPESKKALKKHFLQLIEKNEISKSEKSETEKKLYNSLLTSVRNEILSEQKNIIEDEVNWHVALLMKISLRNVLQKELQKALKPIISNETTIPKLSLVTKNAATTMSKSDFVEEKVSLIFYPLEKGQIIPLDGIFFEKNSANLLHQSDVELTRLKNLLLENPAMMIEIRVHTNNSLPYASAQSLTTERSGVIRDALVKKGVFPDKIQNYGYGKFTPIVNNNTETNRLKNQRIEFKVITR
jgi:outer membrane protein OmpA-like peptidoglycan-associated protein